jgi:CheY-like chemotaxis protein
LAISRRLIGLMGGTMSVVSKPGRGSTFFIDLVLPRALSPVPPSLPNLQTTAEIQLTGTVLLVEDNAINQLMAKAMLKRLGLDVQVASNGAQAVERVKAFAFDLVLMDCQMPVMDGFEATRIIRQLPLGRGLDLPIVALTANTVLGIEQQCMAVGMNAFIGKPYTLTTLRTTLMRWLVPQPLPMLCAPAVASSHAAPHAIHPATLKTLREMDQFGGMGLARSVFLAYLESAGAGLNQVKEAIEASDGRALGQLAHALKSSSANVGANDLSICYRELERLGRDGLMGEAYAVFKHALREHEHAVSHIHELLLEIQ